MNQIICAHKLSPLPFLPVPPSRTSWQVIVSHPTEGDRYEIDRYSVANTEPTPPASRQQPNGPSAQMPQTLPLSSSGDPQVLIAKWAYERYVAQGHRHGSALDDWLEAEREILHQSSSA